MQNKTFSIITPFLDKLAMTAIYGLIFILPFSKAGIEIFATVAIISWLLRNALIHKLKIRHYFIPTRLNMPVFVLSAILIASTFTSIKLSESIEGLIFKWFEYFLLFFICVDVFYNQEINLGRKRLAVLIIVIMISSAILFLDGAVQAVTDRDFIRNFTGGTRVRASFGNENDFAGYVISILPVLFCIIPIVGNGVKNLYKMAIKIVAAVLFMAGSILLIKTYSRGAWLGYSISIIFLLLGAIFINIKNKKFFAGLIIFCIVTSLISGFLFIKPIKNRLESTAGAYGTTSRLIQWKEALLVIEDFPLLGSGPNTYTKVNTEYAGTRIQGGYAHNSYLQIAAEAGILGLAAFLWLLWNFFNRCIRAIAVNRKDSAYAISLLGLMTGMTAYLVQSFFDTNMFSLQLVILFWIMLGVGVSLYKQLEPKATG